MFYTFNVNQMIDRGDTLRTEQKSILEQVLFSVKMICSSFGGSINLIDDEFGHLENFI